MIDKLNKKIHLSEERWRHIKGHPDMHSQLENIQLTLQKPTTIRYFDDNDKVLHYYKDFKNRDPSERYLLASGYV